MLPEDGTVLTSNSPPKVDKQGKPTGLRHIGRSLPQLRVIRDSGGKRNQIGSNALQLPASSVDIEAARFSDEARNGLPHDVLKRRHSFGSGRLERNAWSRIQRDQIHFAV